MIAACGEALVDFTAAASVGGERAFVALPGGSPCNVAVGIARLRTPAAFVGKLSTDYFGELLRAHLAASGVSLRWAARGDQPSALAFVIPRDRQGRKGQAREGQAQGQAHDFAFYGDDTADRNFTLADAPTEFPDDVAALHFGSYSLVLGKSDRAYAALMQRERRRRVISLDPNVRPTLFPNRAEYRRRIERLVGFAHLVKASADDLEWLYPGELPLESAARWLGIGASVVAVTLGADGAVAMAADGRSVHSRGIAVNVADTVGAGDAFTAGLLAYLHNAGWLRAGALAGITHHALEAALARANLNAARACGRQGAGEWAC